MRQSGNNPINLRATILGVFFSIWLMVIGGRAVYLQVFQGDFLARKASDQYEASFRAEGKRGVIYDANRKVMAISTDATSICAYPGKINDVSGTAAILAGILSIDRQYALKKLSLKRSFVWVERQVTPKESAAISELELAGIGFLTENKRYYPNLTLAAQVLGFTNIDDKGLEGIEWRYNEDLRGKSNSRTILKDALGRGYVTERSPTADDDGHDLVLTIDRTVQFITEQALQEVVSEFSAESAMAVVMVPETGAVLAMAHYPFFNPNVRGEFEQWRWRNRAITDPFEPGSTMKIFTAAAAIEKGGVSANTIFYCENGSYRVAGHSITDTHENGWLSLQQIVKVSSNIGAVKVMENIGPEVLYTTLRDFGFGEKTGIDCPGETPGRLVSYKRWRGMDGSAVSFGHGLSVSAVQLAAAVNALANDGVLMRPYVVQAVVDDAGRDVKRFEPQPMRRAVSVHTARTVAGMMKTVTTEGGTGAGVALDEYPVAGKTGTAQKADEKGIYNAGRYVASFAGFVPADDPRATIVVIVDEPKHAHYGGLVAGPAFKKIARELMLYLNVPAEYTNDRLTVSVGDEVRG